MRRLTPLDAQFLAGERGAATSHAIGLIVCETGAGRRIDAATVKRRLARRIEEPTPLRWRLRSVPLGLDHPVFVDTEVDLDEHVEDRTLPRLADDRALSRLVGELLTTPLDRTRPLWRITVVHGLEGRVVLAFAVHHAAADAFAMRQMFTALVDDLEAPEPAPGANAVAGRVPRTGELVVRAAGNAALHPVRALRIAPGLVPNLDQTPVLRSLPGVDTLSRIAHMSEPRGPRLVAPRTRFNVPLRGPRSVAFGTLPLDEVRSVRTATGVTVNDVVMALCAGALRRRLRAWGELPEQPLVAYVPVSVRPPGGDHFGNAISSIVALIPTHLAGARERLSFANDTMAAAKRRHRTVPTTLLSDTAALIPAPLFSVATGGVFAAIRSGRVPAPVNLVISNVMGPPTPLRSQGARILAQYPQSLVFDGIALNITVVSYVDGLDVGITADGEALPDAWELLDDMRAELRALRRVTMRATLPV